MSITEVVRLQRGEVTREGRAVAARPILRLSLMRGFGLSCDGRRVELPHSAQRLLAFLALHDRPVPRSYVGQILYADSAESRLSGNVRSALWRLRRTGHELVEAHHDLLSLSRTLVVDVHHLSAVNRLITREAGTLSAGDLDELFAGGELLPGWYEEWVVMERERVRQLWLQTMEAASHRLSAAGRHDDAVVAALAAAESEPLRESAHRMVIAAHLAAGNRADALRQYRRYASVLDRELHLEPSPEMRALTRGLDQGTVV